MKLLLSILLLCWSWSAWGQPILRNSLNTNTLGTNLVWTPLTRALEIENNNGSFSVISNGITQAAISATPGGNILPDLNLLNYLQFESSTNRLRRSGNNLLWDGLPLNGGSTVTNIYNNIQVTNLTVISTNIFNVSKGGHLTVSNSLSVLTVLTNLLATDATGLITNAVYGTGIAWDPATRTLSSTASGGGGSAWVPNAALTYSGGTNVTMSAAGSTNFTLLVTNTVFMTAPNDAPASTGTNTTWTVAFKMDGTGTWAVTWTNLFKFPGGVQFQPTTNAGAFSLVTITTSPYTNGQYWVDYGVLGLQ